jgi:hypothetical protein
MVVIHHFHTALNKLQMQGRCCSAAAAGCMVHGRGGWLVEQSSSPSAPCMHATGSLSNCTSMSMRLYGCCLGNRTCVQSSCTPGLTSVKLPKTLSLSLSLSLSFKLELAEPSYRSAASHGLWGVHASLLMERERERLQRVTSAWPRALLWLSGSLLYLCCSTWCHMQHQRLSHPRPSLLLIHDNSFILLFACVY